MTRQDLADLVDYNYWARDRVLAALEPLTDAQFDQPAGGSFGSIRKTLVHMYGAEWVWLQRWKGSSPAALAGADSLTDLRVIRSAWTEVERELRAHVAGLDDDAINRVTEYRLFSGEPRASRFSHMLQHVVNHGTHHRGQVVTLLRVLGAEPPKSLDLIAYYRERGA
jgi:uncharacterized damage-inducible protein DinB